MTNIYLSDDAISIISETKDIPSSIISKAILGKITSEDISEYTQYDQLFRLRHDYSHWHICKYRGLSFGERKIFTFPEFAQLVTSQHWQYIKNQSPDIINVIGKIVQITEITVTNSRLAKKEKVTKYSLLIDVLRKSGFEVELEVIVIPAAYTHPTTTFLIEEHKLDLETVDIIYDGIRNINKIIHMIESTPYGQEWAIRRNNQHFSDVDMGISKKQCMDYHQSCSNKAFKSSEILDWMLDDKNNESEITLDDTKFLNRVIDKALSIDSDLTKMENFNEAYMDLVTFHDKHSKTKELRSFLPLPFLNDITVDSSLREAKFDEDEFTLFRSKLHETRDPILYKLGDVTSFRSRLPLSMTDKYNIALQGPGRKRFVNMNSEPHMKEQKKHKNYWFHFQDPHYVHSVESLSYQLCEETSIDINNPSQSFGVGINYVKCCQSIYRELILNAMRKDRRHDFIFKPTGVRGVYILIYPGAKLRTGENLSTIWYKLITTTKYIPITYISNHWAFKTWNLDGEVRHTNWLSIDANRLDHYLRCYDRILMTYLSYIHYSPGHLSEAIKNDSSNTLGIIIMIYMEDKRSTSKMLQDLRYLVMGSLSKYRWWGELFKKYKEPVRTPLQAYLLHQSINYARRINSELKEYIEKFKFGKVFHDSDTISDRLAGVTSKLPRLLTSGPDIPFQQLLCEMYFTMLFNKNQDDPTHATFQILDKMLEGEASLSKVKQTTALHTGSLSIDDIDQIVDHPMKNQFSALAIMIGSKLQSMHESNVSPAGLSHRKAAQNPLLNKPLSDFATYKSSAVFENKILNVDLLTRKKERKTENKDGLEEKFREGADEDDDEIQIHTIVRQNPRRRCIESVMALLNNGYMRSFDLIRSTITDEMFFQVFKKNQIGGVREILILPIEKRITINILESFSRLICKEDEREMLTHGDMKLTLMRDMIRDVKRSPDHRRIILNYNLDKTRWGPSFMPIQFAYMFKPFSHHYPSLFRFIVLSLMVHTNKKCLIPEKLIQVWMNDLGNSMKHSVGGNITLLQSLKERFIKTKELYFENESNMGQGILHYTSSYLHLCALSFRDYIYKGLCNKIGITPGVWRDIVSSDDSYTAQALPLDDIKRVKMRIDLFVKSQEITERLFNIWTSRSKSSISFLISEFNSMFGSNLTLFPTLLKFSLASVMPFNTDSFFRMVKESYNVTRQIVENGGSLELYMVAHKLNKNYCESIYHTGTNDMNDLSSFGLNPINVPYQLGVYPISDPGMMIMLGPEVHNYDIISRSEFLSPREYNLLMSCHTLIPINNPELYAELGNFDNIFTGLLRIEAAVGPVRKLQRIKRQIPWSWEKMNNMIQDDLLITLREPKTLDEMKLCTYLKLFSYGSSESLRETAASIYYARVAATVSATAFQIPYDSSLSAKYVKGEGMVGYTYRECITHLIERKNELIDITQFYPHMKEFTDLKSLSSVFMQYIHRSSFETQNIKTLQLGEVTMRIKNPIRDLLESFWIDDKKDKPTSYYRDWINLKELVPILQDSLPMTLDQLKGDTTTRVKILLLILMRVMGYSSKPMKAVIYGPSCRSYDQSYLTLSQQNKYHNFTNESLISSDTIDNNPRIYDKLFFFYNYFTLSLLCENKIFDLTEYFDEPINMSYLRDNFINRASKKKIMILLMYFGYLDNVSEWTEKTKTILHFWIQRQYRGDDGQYHGNFSIKMQCGANKLILEKYGRAHRVIISTADNPMINYELLQGACELTQITIDHLINNLPKGGFLISTGGKSIHHTNTTNGVRMILDTIQDIQYSVGDIEIKEEKDQRFLILNDSDGYQIVRTPFGLLPTEYHDMTDIPDIMINGVSFQSLVNMRFLHTDFRYDHISQKDMLESLQDLKVPKPKISTITKERLSNIVSNTWETHDYLDAMNDLENFEEETDDILNDLISTDVTDDTKEIISSLNNEEDVFDMLLTEVDIGLITSLPTTSIKFQPQRILDRVLNSKYQLVARSAIDVRSMSEKTIRLAYMSTHSIDLVYSLVFLYDKLYTTIEAPSPNTITIHWNSDFHNKFFKPLLSDAPLNLD